MICRVLSPIADAASMLPRAFTVPACLKRFNYRAKKSLNNSLSHSVVKLATWKRTVKEPEAARENLGKQAFTHSLTRSTHFNQECP